MTNTSDFPTHIFKAYDIRGIYPSELDESLAYKIGRAFTYLLQQEEHKTILNLVVSSDMRISSPSLKKEIIRGITDQGANVIDIGLASTPTFYFAVADGNYDGGLIVSASHNPKEYNGFKMVRKKAIPISKETGIYTIREQVKQNMFPKQKKGTITKKQGTINDQITHDLGYINPEVIKPFRIVADPANSMGAQYLDALFDHIPGTLIKINFTLDGTFPAHQADPLDEKNLTQLKQKVLEEHADLGIATDGDGDRVFFIDDQGETIPPHVLRGLLAKIFLKTNPGATICYDIRPGRITKDMILEYGGKPVVTRVGHSLIKEKMREVDAVFAGESSGHYFLRFDHGYYEAPVVMIGKILEELSSANITFSELVKPYKKYVHSGEINSKVDDKDQIIDNILNAHQDAKHIDHLDGITIEYDDYWFNIRPSNTEPLLRLNLEAKTQEIMETQKNRLLALIRS
jgi:phosphomannomutase